jgi:hypothetical protein
MDKRKCYVLLLINAGVRSSVSERKILGGVNSTEITTHFDNMLLDLRGKLTGNKYSKEIMDHLELIKLTNEKKIIV